MPWPTDTITTTHLDSATDDPSQARAELLTVAQKTKEVIAGRATTNGVCELDSSGKIPAARLTSAAISTGIAGTITGNVNLTGSATTVGPGTGDVELRVNGGPSTPKHLLFRTAGVHRWSLFSNNQEETGNNEGSNCDLGAYADAGTWLGRVWRAFRSTRNIKFGTRTDTDSGARVHVDVNTTTPALQITQAGSGDCLLIEDQASPDSTPFVIDLSGRVVMGHTWSVNGIAGTNWVPFQTHSVSNQPSVGAIGQFHWNATDASNSSRYEFHRSRSDTIATHEAVLPNDVLGRINFNGSDGTVFRSSVLIRAIADAAVSDNSVPGRLTISTTPEGGTDGPQIALQIYSTGKVAAVRGQLGYGPGAGGAVTQTTSKSTGVTIDKPCGRITTHNEALAANTTVTFTVTNSAVSNSDTIVIHRRFGGTAMAYNIWVDFVSAGAFTVCVRNISDTSRSEALTLSFAILTTAPA